MYYQIKKEQVINCKIDDLWDFVTSPKNLELITPNEMKFEVNSGNQDEKIYSGMIITYKVSPLLNFKMDWVTEITQVKKNHLFILDDRESAAYFQTDLENVLEKMLKLQIYVLYMQHSSFQNDSYVSTNP